MDSKTDRDIKNDRMWTIAKEDREQFDILYKKVKEGIRLTDGDMVLVKYSLLLSFCELV